MRSSCREPAVRLALADNAESNAEAASWIGPLVALGARASRYAATHSGRQLIIAISVPRRDYAAALVGCGWVLTSSPPRVKDPLNLLRGLKPQTLVRMVTTRDVIVDYFTKLNELTNPPRAHIGNSNWNVSMIKALEVIEGDREPAKMRRPPPGALGRLAGVQDTWDARLASPTADLAIIGTHAWLKKDCEALVSLECPASPALEENGLATSSPNTALVTGSLRDILLPQGPNVATWFTQLWPTARFADRISLADEVRAVVLDGSGATKYLTEIETPIVICVLDRSIADETAAELVVQMRNSRGEPVSVCADLSWNPPPGIEALAFTVAL